MSETFQELSDRIGQVGELYARVHNIERSADWYLLKLTEELGELTAEHLLVSGRAKPDAVSSGGTREALENEAADLFGQLVLYLRANEIDIEAAIERKWLRHLDKYAYSNETGRRFRELAGRLFQRHAGRVSDAKPDRLSAFGSGFILVGEREAGQA